MNHKKILLALMVVFLLILLFVFVIWEPPYDNLCGSGILEDRNCVTLVNNISEPIFWSFLSLLPITFILFFLRRETFLAWAKFAGVTFPLMLGILLYTYNNAPTEGGFGLAGLISDEMLATVFLPPIFVIASLLIIGIKSWKLRK